MKARFSRCINRNKSNINNKYNKHSEKCEYEEIKLGIQRLNISREVYVLNLIKHYL